MTHRTLTGFLFALGFCFGTTSARAGLIEWSYGSFSTPGTVNPDKGAPGPKLTSVKEALGVDPWPPAQPGVTFTNFSSEMAGTSRIVVANLSMLTFAGPNAPDVYDRQGFDLGIGIYDKEANRSKVAIFHGVIDGTVSTHFSRLKITFADDDLVLHLGHHLYEIHIDTITLPGANGSVGAIGAEVQVHHNPEPSSLLLLAFGTAGLGWFRWRRARATSINPHAFAEARA